MNLAVVSATGWTRHQDGARTLLARLAAQGGDETVMLDADTIAREGPGAHGLTCVIDFSDWIKDGRLAQEAINPQAILSAAHATPVEAIVLVDARNYSVELIAQALAKARLAWYPLERWHPVFALVSDDVNLLRVLALLASTFYSQPQVLSEREVRLIVRAMMRRAFIYRWFGARAGRALRWLEKTLRRLRWVRDRISAVLNHPSKA